MRATSLSSTRTRLSRALVAFLPPQPPAGPDAAPPGPPLAAVPGFARCAWPVNSRLCRPRRPSLTDATELVCPKPGSGCAHSLFRLVPCLWKHFHPPPGESPAVSLRPLWTLAGPEAASSHLCHRCPAQAPSPTCTWAHLRQPPALAHSGVWDSSADGAYVSPGPRLTCCRLDGVPGAGRPVLPESQVQAGRFLLRPLSVCRRCLIPCPHVVVPLRPDLIGTQVTWGPA